MTAGLWMLLLIAAILLAALIEGEAGAERDRRRAMKEHAQRLKDAELERDSDYYGRTPR